MFILVPQASEERHFRNFDFSAPVRLGMIIGFNDSAGVGFELLAPVSLIAGAPPDSLTGCLSFASAALAW